MNIRFPKNKSEIIRHIYDPLFKTSFYILLASVSSAGFGFIFWILAAKLYSPEDVGIATAMISSMALLVLISRFGLDYSIIRFFPANNKSKIFSTSAIVTTFFAVIFGVIYIAGIDIFSPELGLLQSPLNSMLYLIFLAANSVITLTAIAFAAVRKADFQFLQSIIVGSRIIFLIPLITLGAIGIFGAVGISFVLALLTAFMLLMRSGIRPGFMIERRFLTDSFHFSAGNYLAGLFMHGSNTILPILVLNILGAEQAAYYYIAYMLAAFLFMIPSAISLSLFVEGSHGEALKSIVIKSLIVIFSLMVPVAVVLFIYGEWMLEVIGADYAAGGLGVLRMMIIASLFVSVNYVYFAIKRVQKDVKGLVVLSGLIFGLLIGLSYVFMLMFGIVGIGYAWVVGNGIGSIYVVVAVWRKMWV